jgi:hypothetical protein
MKSSGSCLENREYGRRYPSRWPRRTLYPYKLAITSLKSGGRSVGIVRSWSQTKELVIFRTNKLIKEPASKQVAIRSTLKLETMLLQNVGWLWTDYTVYIPYPQLWELQILLLISSFVLALISYLAQKIRRLIVVSAQNKTVMHGLAFIQIQMWNKKSLFSLYLKTMCWLCISKN